MRLFSRICCTVLLVAAAARAQAQPATRPVVAGEELSIYVLTMGQGDEIFEKFGHNAIWIRDRAAGTDLVYNWGMFDFAEEKFFVNFLLGRLNYWLEPFPAEDTVRWYKSLDRSVEIQELNLTPAQRLKLRDFAAWHALPENRTYLYNYYTDNCSTRVRDAIDLAVDGALKRQLQGKPTGTTWRWHTRRLTRGGPVWYSLLNTVLGPAVDKPIDAWEESFLPLRLRDHMEHVTIPGVDGSAPVPLIRAHAVLHESSRAPEPDAPPNWIVQHFLIGAAVACGFAGLAHLAPRGRAVRAAFVTLATLYALLVGVAGALSLWAWTVSDHWAAWRNENLFAFTPLALPLAFVLPAMRRRWPRAGKVAVALAIAVLASTLLGAVAQLLPGLDQVNGEPLALIVPINVALAWSVWRYARLLREDPKGPEDAPPAPDTRERDRTLQRTPVSEL